MKITVMDVLVVLLCLVVAIGWTYTLYQFEVFLHETEAILTGLYLIDDYYVLSHELDQSQDPVVAEQYRREQQETLRQIHEQATYAGDRLPDYYQIFLAGHPLDQ